MTTRKERHKAKRKKQFDSFVEMLKNTLLASEITKKVLYNFTKIFISIFVIIQVVSKIVGAIFEIIRIFFPG